MLLRRPTMLPIGLFLTPLLGLHQVRAEGNVTCADSSVSWWYNSDGDSPCKLYEELVGLCQTGFEMYGTDTETSYFCNKNGGGGTNNACCCNSVTFAMLQACIYCQNGVTNIGSPESYGYFLKSGGACQDPSLIQNGSIGVDVSDLNIPPWGFIDITSGDSSVWNYGVAQSNATKFAAQMATSSALSQSSVAQASESSKASQSSASLQSVASLSSIGSTITSISASPTFSSTSPSASADAGSVVAPTTSDNAKKSGISSGGIAGIVVAVAVIAALVAVGLWWMRRRKTRTSAFGVRAVDILDDDEGPRSKTPVMTSVSPYYSPGVAGEQTPQGFVPQQTYSQTSSYLPTNSYFSSHPAHEPSSASYQSSPPMQQQENAHPSLHGTPTSLGFSGIATAGTDSTSDGQSVGSSSTGASNSRVAALKGRLPAIEHADEEGAAGQEQDAGPAQLARNDTLGQTAPPRYDAGWSGGGRGADI